MVLVTILHLAQKEVAMSKPNLNSNLKPQEKVKAKAKGSRNRDGGNLDDSIFDIPMEEPPMNES